MRSSWTNIHNTMLKLCLNNNYKQFLGELSRPVRTESTPGQCWAQGFFLEINPEDNHQRCVGKRHTTSVKWCTKFRHRLHGNEKAPYAHVDGDNAIQLRNITNAILYIGLMTWCHKSLHLEKLPSWSRLKRAHYLSKPFDLLEIKITFVLQLRKFW